LWQIGSPLLGRGFHGRQRLVSGWAFSKLEINFCMRCFQKDARVQCCWRLYLDSMDTAETGDSGKHVLQRKLRPYPLSALTLWTDVWLWLATWMW
jgi:hypothetical protein